MTQQMRVRLDATIPKLLVKVSPEDARASGLKNLGEITLRKPGTRKARERIAVVNIAGVVPRSEVG